jgi:hypothetical protein
MVTMRRAKHVVAGQHHADGQRVRWRTAQPPRRVGKAQYVADHTPGFIKKCATWLSQFDAARRAAKQGEADLLFQKANLFTADCEMLSRAAALVKLRSLATESAYRISRNSTHRSKLFSDFAYCQIAKGESRDGMLALRRSDDEAGPDLRLARLKQPGMLKASCIRHGPKS